MAGNDHTSRLAELAEIVRLYSSALINYHGITPFEYPVAKVKKTKKGKSVEVKLPKSRYAMPPKEKPKPRKKKKPSKKAGGGYKVDAELVASMHLSDRKVTHSQLSELREQAELAIAEASQLLDEQAVYVFAQLVPASTIGDTDPCRDIKQYKLVNGW
jgi:hypothetical protein